MNNRSKEDKDRKNRKTKNQKKWRKTLKMHSPKKKSLNNKLTTDMTKTRENY